MLMIGELTFCLSLAPLHITGIHALCTCLFVTYLVHITHLDPYSANKTFEYGKECVIAYLLDAN